MPNQTSKSGAFLGWVGGIAATVISAVLIYHFTQPKPPPVSFPPVGVTGFVSDTATHKLMPGATVTVTLGSQSIEQATDFSGKYSIVLPGVGTTETMGRLSVRAPGYQSESNSVPLKPSDDNYFEVLLESSAPPPPTGAPQPGLGANLHPGIILKHIPPDFAKPLTKYAVKQP